MVDNAYETYMACHTKEAIAMAEEAMVKSRPFVRLNLLLP